MTTISAPANATDPLATGVRRIRRVGRPDAPVAVTRASLDGAETVLLMDATAAADWPGWRCAGAQHLFGPVDVLRRHDGHDAVLPDLGEPCERACGVRESNGVGWHRGEVVTLVVSALRGVVEAAERGLDEADTGSWWFTSDRRPVFAFSADSSEGAGVAEASQGLMRRVAAACDDRVVTRAIDDALEAIERPGSLARRIDRLEQALFDAAAPQPIDRDGATRARQAAREPRVIVDDDEPPRPLAGLVAALERHLDARVSALVRNAARSILGFVRGPRPVSRPPGDRARRGDGDAPRSNRWRVALVAGVAALAVIVAGVLWPEGSAGRAAAHARGMAGIHVTAPLVDRAPTETARPITRDRESARQADTNETHGSGAFTRDDPVRAARALLADWDECDEPCDAMRGIARAGAVASADRTVDLVDDYGAVALLAVHAPASARQLLVIERADSAWRVRDLYRAPEE